MNKPRLFIGLMSGTSVDGIDAVLARFDSSCELIAAHSHPIPNAIKQEIRDLFKPGENEVERIGKLEGTLAELYAQAVKELLEKANVEAKDVEAIGCHGQTIRHRPPLFTLQIGDANRLAQLTSIDVVADFRRRDMAEGGQGAPLAPAFHAAFMSAGEARAILNLGGIANLTYLIPGKAVIGFDVGPANALLDAWAQKHIDSEFDANGAWAAQGKVCEELLAQLMTEPYFALPPPKSSGKELFNLHWLETSLDKISIPLSPEDIQASLCELTVESIAQALEQEDRTFSVYVCGGGVHNHHLMERLRTRLSEHRVDSSESLGVDPDWLEALCFAWLAKQFIDRKPGNLPSVTGANKACVLGALFPA